MRPTAISIWIRVWVTMEAGEHIMAIRKILLVDDEADIRTVGRLSLSTLGSWEVVEASNGPEGIERATLEQPDLILLDVMMPGMDGPTTFGKLRTNANTKHIPVIFMTAKVQKHEIERYMKLGAKGVISKPFDPMSLPKEIIAITGS